MSQRRTWPSTDALASIRPDGLNATAVTGCAWPPAAGANTRTQQPSPMLHRRTVWSALPVARYAPFGWNAAVVTSAAWPTSTRAGTTLLVAYTRAVRSREHDTK